MLSHAELWTAIDALAKRFDMSPSAMAKLAGLDPTAFNRSKRGDADTRPRWPSTESLAKVLEATGVGFSEFAALTETSGLGGPGRRAGVPLIGLARAGTPGMFDEAGAPRGTGWEEVELPGPREEGLYALEVEGDALAPVYRDGDRLLVSPTAEPRRGDRVVVMTTDGEVLIREMGRLTARTIELTSVLRDGDDRVLDRMAVAWAACIQWVSQ
ncbi:S24 family peptidase [Caulobacter hibisci]|uniref:Helix-turn-helix transcriptional regulator n=1 Tax=Caulobacter hibisci TaxID=2035993 RepID=A0ABS0T7B6_9CAUL|nr:helix-turn-helix transcriptional regulator [Caulobacter hibisci]MBI1686955.1 helix-turn-helix transcriptional regulator [Caulobacter hibisci]